MPAGVGAALQVVRLRRVQAVRPALAPALVQQMLRPGLPHGRRRVVLRVALHLPARRRLEAPPRARRRGHRRGEPLHEGAEHGHHRGVERARGSQAGALSRRASSPASLTLVAPRAENGVGARRRWFGVTLRADRPRERGRRPPERGTSINREIAFRVSR